MEGLQWLVIGYSMSVLAIVGVTLIAGFIGAALGIIIIYQIDKYAGPKF